MGGGSGGILESGQFGTGNSTTGSVQLSKKATQAVVGIMGNKTDKAPFSVVDAGGSATFYQSTIPMETSVTITLAQDGLSITAVASGQSPRNRIIYYATA